MTQAFTRKQIFPRQKVKCSAPKDDKTMASVKKPKTETIASDDEISLYKDICRIFKDIKGDKLRSTRLISHLCSDPKKPWATFNDGKPLNAWQLNRMLKPFGIHSKGFWFKKLKKSCKGFLKAWFSEKITRPN